MMEHSSLRQGLIVAAIAAVVFTLIAVAALRQGKLAQFDRDLALTLRDYSEGKPLLRHVAILFTHLGGIPAMTGVALLVALWQVYRRRWIVALGCALIPATGGLFDLLLKTSFDRPRPDLEWRDAAVHETNESFPSGHSMGSAVGFGLLGYSLFLQIKGRRARWTIGLGLTMLVLLVGLSRVYLRAHWATDVLGGFAIGVAWLAAGLGILEWLRLPTNEAATIRLPLKDG